MEVCTDFFFIHSVLLIGAYHGKTQPYLLTPHVQISPSDVLAPSRPGRKVVILGDTCDSSDMIPIARGADLVVHEATNENSHEMKCQENGHSTPSMF